MPLVESDLCSVLQCDAVCCSVLQRVAVCGSVLQCVAHTNQYISWEIRQEECLWLRLNFAVFYSVLHCVAVCCSVLQCVAVCCSVLQRVAVCCTYNSLYVRTKLHNEHTNGWVWIVNTYIYITPTKIILYVNTKCILNHSREWFVTTSIPMVEYEFCIHICIYLQQKSFSTWIKNSYPTMCENNLWEFFVTTSIPMVQYEFYWEWLPLEKTIFSDVLSQPNSNSQSQTAKVIYNKSHSRLNDREWLLLLQMNLADSLSPLKSDSQSHLQQKPFCSESIIQ